MIEDIDIFDQFQIMIADLKVNPHVNSGNTERSEAICLTQKQM